MSTPLQTEALAMFSTVAIMFAAVIMKFITMRLIVRMNQTIKEVQEQKALLLNELRNASTQLAIQERRESKRQEIKNSLSA